jgi:hypothetical protein
MPDDLQPGASFEEVVNSEPQDETQVSTPEGDVVTDPPATDGGTTEPETLGILKEELEAQEGEETPDLSVDADLQKHLDAHPIIKAKVEAFIANKEKGVDKFIQDHNAKVKELQTFRDQNQDIVGFAEGLKDPETVEETFKALSTTLAQAYGRPFGGFDAQGNSVTAEAPSVDGKSKYGLEYAEDDAVVEAAAKLTVSQVVNHVKAMLDERLGPVENERKATEAAKATTAQAAEALPNLKAEFEVSTEPWVTQELVEEAMRAYPGVPAKAAFAAHFVRRIAQYTAKHSAAKPQVKNLPANNGGGASHADLKPGATFAEIVAAESVG